ncbi:hypothetical protein DPMN_025664 [Dreissena polymorpha]|uniref:Uncharacterized protein n=1 Tax=Dreissena polymorpha TaxID=45954 RepID=A0A9D4LTP4_DREPO|nr:hypothetical protein DPMN_025664 [Dreissena polymorpha]
MSAKFRRSSTPTPRDKCGFRLLLWGNGASTGQLEYLRRHSPETMALRHALELGA